MENRRNKKGQMTVFLILMIVAILFTAIMLFAGGIVVVKINEVLDQDIDMGEVNLRDINADHFGVFTSTFLNNADWWGLSVIFGLIMGLFLSSYFLRNRFPKWGIILDIFMITGAFIAALYISSIYITLLDALASAGETFLEEYTPKTSMFVKNLPVFTVIIGVIMMVLMHSAIPKKTEETIQE
ncbi:unnamed protein product, partial [marine sediment metagenome]